MSVFDVFNPNPNAGLGAKPPPTPALPPPPGKGYTPYSGSGVQVNPNAPTFQTYGNPDDSPKGQTFNSPVQQSGWTGVSSAQDPYGVHNIGYNLDNAATGIDKLTGKPTTGGVLDRDVLLGSSGYGQNVGPGGTPLFTGYSKYENAGAPSGDGGASAAAAASAANAAPAAGGSSYPAMDNSYGLGGAMPSSAPTPSASAYSGQQGLTVNIPDMSSRGFNPWSMVGEANARDNDKGVVQPQNPVL